MRIAIVGTELCAVDARGGGLEQVLRRWAAALGERHHVVVVSHQPGGRPLVPDDVSERVVVATTADLGPALQRIAPDAISLHNRPRWVALCDPRAVVGVTFHNYPSAWKSAVRRPPPARLSAVSESLASAACERLGGAEVSVVPPSIDPVYLQPRERRPAPIVLSPNRLMGKKGVVELLAAARRPELAAVSFEFADLISPWLRPTAEHRRLREAIGAVDNASLFAPTGAPGLVARYATAGVVVCAAQEPEGLGLVPLEAQACGAPVVTTDAGGLREATFAPNECVAVGDADALADALVRALHRDGAPAARHAVLDRYTPAASAAALERWLLSRG